MSSSWETTLGRPKIALRQAKTSCIPVKFTATEKAAVERAAGALRPGVWARAVLVSEAAKTKRRGTTSEIIALIAKLDRLSDVGRLVVDAVIDRELEKSKRRTATATATATPKGTI